MVTEDEKNVLMKDPIPDLDRVFSFMYTKIVHSLETIAFAVHAKIL